MKIIIKEIRPPIVILMRTLVLRFPLQKLRLKASEILVLENKIFQFHKLE